ALGLAVSPEDEGSFVVEGVGALHGIVAGERAFVIVAVDGLEGFANVVRPHGGAEAGDFGHVLAHQLIEQAAGADLVLRLLGVLGTHGADQRGGDFVFGDAADLLGVVFAVKEIGVDPLAAVLEESAVFHG